MSRFLTREEFLAGKRLPDSGGQTLAEAFGKTVRNNSEDGAGGALLYLALMLLAIAVLRACGAS